MVGLGRRDLFKKAPGAAAAAGLATGIVASAASAEPEAPGSGAPKHVVLLVLDRSGSMGGLKDAVIQSVNDYLDEQKDLVGMHVGVVQFDSFKTKDGNFCEPIFGFTPAANTPRLGPNDYQPRGGTPLLAAVAEAISKLEQVVRPMDRALLVIQTDGYENQSPPEITKGVIRSLIKAKEAEGNWTFAFMGADIDAWGEGGSLGMQRGSTLTYANTAGSTQVAYARAAGSTQAWYSATAGGQSVEVVLAAPANTNLDFFAPKPVDITLPVAPPAPKKPRTTVRSKVTPPDA